MEDPVAEIPHVISLLTQSPPTVQRLAIDRYFTRNASFTHPFCVTGSFSLPTSGYGPYANSRWLIHCIYRWYKVMSPDIELKVEDIAYNPESQTLYLSIWQGFSIWVIPFHSARVRLVTKLQLVRGLSADETGRVEWADRADARYFIRSQEDLYQTTELVKFVSLFRVLWFALWAWQALATLACVLGQAALAPVSWWEERRAHQTATAIDES